MMLPAFCISHRTGCKRAFGCCQRSAILDFLHITPVLHAAGGMRDAAKNLSDFNNGAV